MNTINLTLVGGACALAVRVAAPEHWETRALENGSAALLAPVVEGEFTTNAVLSVMPLDPEDGMVVAIAAVRAARDSLAQVALLGEGVFEVDGREWFITEYAYADPRAGTLVQSVRTSLAQVDGVPAAVRATATLSSVDAEEGLKVVREVLASVTW